MIIDEHSPEYKKRIASESWKYMRRQKIEEAQYRCEKCGISQWSAPLEVHHLTYQRLGKELLSDLQVLCASCHAKEHAYTKPTATESTRSNAELGHYGDFERTMSRRFGVNWMLKLTNERIAVLYSSFMAQREKA